MGGLVSSQLGLIPSVKQIGDDLGESRTEAKLVLGHLSTPWPPHHYFPVGCILWEGCIVATWVDKLLPWPGLKALLCKTEGLETEALQGPIPCWRVGQGQVETGSILQKAPPSIASMPSWLQPSSSFYLLDLNQNYPDSSRARDTVADKFYTHSPPPILSFPSLFFTPRISSFIIPILKAAK